MQQEASRKLGFSIKKTMSVAQGLYEGVKITENTKYMVKIHLDGGNTNGRKD